MGELSWVSRDGLGPGHLMREYPKSVPRPQPITAVDGVGNDCDGHSTPQQGPWTVTCPSKGRSPSP